MNFNSIEKAIRDELEKEMLIREEIMYKKGFTAGLKVSEDKSDKKFDKKTVTSLVAESIEVGLDCALTISEMEKSERFKLFGSECLSGIMSDWNATEIAEIIYDYLVSKVNAEKEREKEDVKCDSETIGEILDSNLSDEMKKMILQAIDEGAEVKIIEIQ